MMSKKTFSLSRVLRVFQSLSREMEPSTMDFSSPIIL
jgi:hypothetical protein